MPRYKATFQSQVREGVLECLPDLLRACRGLEGKRVAVTIEEGKKKRSIRQNKYYWKIIVPHVVEMFNGFGNSVSPNEVHDFLKLRVGKLVKFVKSGERQGWEFPGTTTTLSTAEFETYMEKCRAFAAEYGTVIPLPGESMYEL